MRPSMLQMLPFTVLSLLISALLIPSRAAMAQSLDLVEESSRLSDAGEHGEAIQLLRQAVASHERSPRRIGLSCRL